MGESKRVKIVRVSSEFLTQLLTQHARRQVIVISGIPSDAKLLAVDDKVYFSTGEVALKFESECWPEVPEGHAIEEFELQSTTVDLYGVLSRPGEYLK